jgi:hypothetical protein
MVVYVLTFDEHDETTEICGIFTTRELAERRKNQLSVLRGYKQAIEGIPHCGWVEITEVLVQDEANYQDSLPDQKES